MHPTYNVDPSWVQMKRRSPELGILSRLVPREEFLERRNAT